MSAFKRNLLIGYGLSLLLLIASAVASFVSIRGLLRSSDHVNRTNAIINKLESVLSVLKDAETGARGFLLSGEDSFLQPYNGSTEKTALLINDIKLMTADNPAQQVDCDLLRVLANRRLGMLVTMIDLKRHDKPLADSMLLASKGMMDGARDLVKKMQDREQALLDARTATMRDFAGSTPTLIIVASVLALLVTVVSFLRVLKDYSNRAALQQALEKKDAETSHRLQLIQGIADQISAGDYQLKVDDAGKDALGSIATALNKMAGSLDYSFTNLKEKEWQQRGIAELNEKLIGENNLEALTDKAIQFLTRYTGAGVGAFYLATPENTLRLSASVNLRRDPSREEIRFGEGVAGQCALSHQPVLLQPLDSTELVIDYSGGSLKPNALMALPIYYERNFKGVVEIASVKEIGPVVQEFLAAAAFNIGTSIHSARDHERLQKLFEQTQAQAEELQAQHSELENVNAELEAQAHKLQSSEEELKVQQEELMQANSELEERSRLLEERNQLILERNLEIQKKAEELAQSTRYKSEFLANMSHELRTPLNSILLLSRLLHENNEKNLSTDQVEYAQVIQSSGQGLLALIDEILDLSKIEAGKMELDFQPVHIAEIMQDMKSLFQPLARDRGLEFRIVLDESLPEQLETDKMRLEQVLKNLLSNALKFTPKGTVSLELAALHDKPDFMTFTVRDTGIGIPAEKQGLIFEAFQQADGSTRRKFGGTGLGLSISRELVRLLGGEIKLTSEPEQGSEFTVYLPLSQQAERQPAPAPRPQPEEAAPKPPAKPDRPVPAPVPDDRNAVNTGDRTILIVEDDTGFARALLDFTRQKGYKGIVAVRGDEGIALARAYRPEGILLDIHLPVKDGWEVMDELKADPQTRHIPIHIMSSQEARRESLLRGAVDFINKPVALEQMGEIFGRIERVVKRENKKVLIVEENRKHAQALAYFLESFHINSAISGSVAQGVEALSQEAVDCVILDMGVPDPKSYEMLESLKERPGLEGLPIIVFTGKNLSKNEEARIKQYADTIVVKTAHSYQRILDEISLFLHLVDETKTEGKSNGRYKRLGALEEVLAGRKVLVADDDVRNIFSLTKILEGHGVQVVSAVDGREALQQLHDHPDTDLVLMDIMMPEMDGYEAIKNIRSQFQHRNLPIIAVTAKAMTGDREKCIRAGASDYISKPVDVDQLLSLLRVWLYDKPL